MIIAQVPKLWPHSSGSGISVTQLSSNNHVFIALSCKIHTTLYLADVSWNQNVFCCIMTTKHNKLLRILAIKLSCLKLYLYVYFLTIYNFLSYLILTNISFSSSNLFKYIFLKNIFFMISFHVWKNPAPIIV